MKNTIIYLLTLSFLLVSCNKPSEMELKTKENLEKSFNDLQSSVGNLATYSMTNVQTKFCNDTLCIISFDVVAQSAQRKSQPESMEYLNIIYGYKKYEVMQTSSEGVYEDEDAYNAEKKGKIYENYSYADGLYYKAAYAANKKGYETLDKTKRAEIPIDMGFGDWKIQSYKDEFGDKTYGKYLTLEGRGTFSNSVTSGSDLTALLIVSHGIKFRFLEHGNYLIKDAGILNFRIKDKDKNIHSFTLCGSPDGDITPFPSDSVSVSNYEKTMNEILLKGGEISCVASSYKYDHICTYNFKFNVSGFKEASEQAASLYYN